MTNREQLREILNVPIFPHENVDPLEAVADYLLDNGVTFATDNNVGRWIPVTERLPEKNVKVLTFGVYGFSVNYRDRFSGKWRGVNGKPQWITHWMPLPEPPQEERKDKNEPKE